MRKQGRETSLSKVVEDLSDKIRITVKCSIALFRPEILALDQNDSYRRVIQKPLNFFLRKFINPFVREPSNIIGFINMVSKIPTALKYHNDIKNLSWFCPSDYLLTTENSANCIYNLLKQCCPGCTSFRYLTGYKLLSTVPFSQNSL